MDLFHFRDAGVAAIDETLAAGRASAASPMAKPWPNWPASSPTGIRPAAAAQAALLADYRRLVAVAP